MDWPIISRNLTSTPYLRKKVGTVVVENITLREQYYIEVS
jgi:hypothetical protein